MKAIVVDRGIGGLTAAIALRQVSVEPVVFECAGELREIEAGIGLWANGVKALRELGLYDAVRALGMPALDGAVCSWRGELISKISAAEMEGFGRQSRPSTTCGSAEGVASSAWGTRCGWGPSSRTSSKTALEAPWPASPTGRKSVATS